MNLFEAILLGIIQGITEFLPISSTGHLTIAGKLLNLVSENHPKSWTSFIAVIQLGTMAAVLVYFAKDIVLIVKDFLKENLSERKKITEQSLNSRMGRRWGRNPRRRVLPSTGAGLRGCISPAAGAVP